MNLTSVKKKLSQVSSISELFDDVTVVFRLHEFFRIDDVIAAENVKCCKLSLQSLPISIVSYRRALRLRQSGHSRRSSFWTVIVWADVWYQVLVAHLVADIIALPATICTTEHKLKDLLDVGLSERVSETILTLFEFLAFYGVLVALTCSCSCRTHLRCQFPFTRLIRRVWRDSMWRVIILPILRCTTRSSCIFICRC